MCCFTLPWEPSSRCPRARALARDKSAPPPPITVSVKGKKPASVLQKVLIQGKLADPGPNKTVTIRVRNEGKPLLTKKVDPKGRHRHLPDAADRSTPAATT